MQNYKKFESSIAFKRFMMLLDVGGSYPLYADILSEKEYKEKLEKVRTYPQIKCFKGLTECLFKNNVLEGLSLYQVRNEFKKHCGFVIGTRIERNRRIDLIPIEDDIPNGCKIVCRELKSCADMTKKELSLLNEIVIKCGDKNQGAMDDDGKEWCSIRDDMDLRSYEKTRDYINNKK